jgi:protease-4
MSTGLDSDALIALRRLRRHLTWWRLLTVAGFALAIFVSIRGGTVLTPDDHVARVPIEGIIVEDRQFLSMLDNIAADPSVRAVIADISSPGGTFTGGEAVYSALRRISEEKPVITVMGGLATSGAYMAAIGTDRIYAGHGTITGSVGVIMQSADVTGLMDKIGVKPEIMKSGSLKATPNPLESLSPSARDQLQTVIDALHLRFMEMVAERRGFSVDEVRRRTGDGRIMTGTAAFDAGLVDAIGDINSARGWLATERGISEDLPLIDWEPDDPLAWWRDGASSIASVIFGKSLLPERLRLDGIQALWHPSMSTGR